MKNTFIITMLCGAVLLAFSPAHAQKNGDTQGERRGPPPEAFSLCENKSSGSSCTMQTRHGNMSGTCKSPRNDGKMVCVPEGHKERQNSKDAE